MTAASGADAGDAYLDRLADTDNPTLQRAVAAVQAERAASGADQPTLRDQLAEALTQTWVTGTPPRELVEHYADALLPLIEADREHAKAEAAAEALEKAAVGAEVVHPDQGWCVPTYALNAQAAALRGET